MCGSIGHAHYFVIAAVLQSSLALYRVLVEVSAQRSEWQQQWQHLHQQHTQLAAQQVRLWQGRTARWMGQPVTAADGVLPALQPLQHQQQQQQQEQYVAAWRDPVLWYCTMRLRQAQQWLSEEQHALDLSHRGLLMWQQLGEHAATQVRGAWCVTWGCLAALVGSVVGAVCSCCRISCIWDGAVDSLHVAEPRHLKHCLLL